MNPRFCFALGSILCSGRRLSGSRLSHLPHRGKLVRWRYMTKRPIPKESGLYSMKIDETSQTGIRKKFTQQEFLWLEILSRSDVYKNMPDHEVREQLATVGIQQRIVDAFLASREPVSGVRPLAYLHDIVNSR